MPHSEERMKIFVGNIDERTSEGEVTALFERYGAVLNCAVMRQYAFVHMRGTREATKAVEELNGRELNGKKMLVELSKPRPQNTWKIFVGNVSSSCEAAEIRKIFEEYGRVLECDIVKDYAFVHMTRESEARAAIEALNGKDIKGKRINVEMSNKVQRSGGANGGSHSRRRPDDREAPQSRESYNHRRATEAAYASYKSNYERRAPEPSRYDPYESRPRPQSPVYYARDRSPMRRSDYASLSQSAALASKYRSELAAYGNLPSAYSAQASALASSYGNPATAAALASSYSNQRVYNSSSSGYGTDQIGSYSTQAAYSNPASSIYGTQSASLASSYGSQPSHMSASPYVSSIVPGTYRPQQGSAYDTASLASLGQQSMTSTNPMYERTRLSPPRTAVADGYKTSADVQRYATDRRFSELSDYRRLSELSAAYRQSPPPRPALDYRRPPETRSDYAMNDFLRSAQLHAGYPRRL
ncbi:RNA-binding protein 14 [Xenopus laevis]|uniref:RNA-binding protein 14 n=3 Tax=Xenopus laevis TaxID=8355 RepID=Q6DDZ4_XENLA|nr:RNA-binding protein 14 [Xenopus laevis]AAH77356.1 LOC398498 protein [Xenopus laevis]OCT81665.1 hypothetical protein XELAEV_18024173mg [Xenopus laevis]